MNMLVELFRNVHEFLYNNTTINIIVNIIMAYAITAIIMFIWHKLDKKNNND